MKKRRITFLLGAGAALPWDGPLSAELDKLIIDDTLFKTKTANKEPLGSYLYKHLLIYYNDTSAINFETVLSFIEYLIEYYTAKSAANANPLNHSIWPYFVNIDKELDKAIFNYRLAYNTDQTNPDDIYWWLIPGDSSDGPIPYSKRLIKSKFLKQAYKHFLDLISTRILKYSTEDVNNTNINASENFRELIKYLISNKFILRFYTTNYDRLIPHLINNEIELFEGFTPKEDGEKKDYDLDISKIHNDRESFVYYNLHGSVHWEKDYDRLSLFPDFKLLKSFNPHNPYLDDIQVEVGSKAFISNIITGSIKTSKMFIPPFKNFEQTFLQDCIQSNIIIVIGTSLSDFNLQKVLSTALSDKTTKLVYIDYAPDQNHTKARNAINRIDPDFKRGVFDDSKFGSCYSNDKKNSFIYLDGFENFLLNEDWKNIDFL